MKSRKSYQTELETALVKNKELEQLLYRFIPAEIITGMELFAEKKKGGGQRIADIEMEGVLITAKQSEAHTDTEDFYGKMLSALHVCGGIVESIGEKKAFLIFQKEYEAACRVMNRQNLMLDSESDAAVYFGCCSGQVRISRKGWSEREALVSSSREKEFSEFLCALAERYKCRILAAEHVVSGIPYFDKRFDYRTFGWITGPESGTPVRVLDIYDGSRAEERKRRTKLFYERGLMLYENGQSREARRYFIEVLKSDREDLTARKYVELCDRRRDDPGHQMCIEVMV